MAVTENQLINARHPSHLNSIPVDASENIYEGTMVFYDATSGYATATATSNAFAGIAKAQADNSSGSAGDISVEVYQDGEFELEGSGFTQATNGDAINASDNYTILTGAGAAVGRAVEFISATKLLVKIEVV